MLQIFLGLLAIGLGLFLWERFPSFKWVLATLIGGPLLVLSVGLLVENARKTNEAAAINKANELATSQQSSVNAKTSVDDFPMNAPLNSVRHTPGTLKISNAARLKLLREELLLEQAKLASATTPEARQLAQSNIDSLNNEIGDKTFVTVGKSSTPAGAPQDELERYLSVAAEKAPVPAVPIAEKKKCPDSGTLAELWECAPKR